VIAVNPTPTPATGGGGPIARPTARPTSPPAQPTAKPTPKPTPKPSPVTSTTRPRPPCPGVTDGPPGHHKVPPPVTRPCSPGQAGNHGTDGGVVVLPFGIGWGLLGSRRLFRPFGDRRSRAA
jgi:hypothetical protein